MVEKDTNYYMEHKSELVSKLLGGVILGNIFNGFFITTGIILAYKLFF